MATGDTGGGDDVAEQPVLTECGGTTVILSGNTLTLNLAMTFKPAYAGAKNIYMHAVDISGTNSGWQQLGTWTVTGACRCPNSGFGDTQFRVRSQARVSRCNIRTLRAR